MARLILRRRKCVQHDQYLITAFSLYCNHLSGFPERWFFISTNFPVRGREACMKKRTWILGIAMAALLFFVLIGGTAVAATPQSEPEENSASAIHSWVTQNGEGFYTDEGKSTYYGRLYAPDGKLVREGYVSSYLYLTQRGYASVCFEDASGRKEKKAYYTSPVNLLMEDRTR